MIEPLTEDELREIEALTEADAEFLAASHSVIPSLITEIRRLRALFTEEDARIVMWAAEIGISRAAVDVPNAKLADLAARIRQVRPTDTGESPP